MDVEFFTLGQVRLTIDGVDARIRGRRERAVLALLLAARRQVLPVDRLIEDVWGDDAGDSTPGSLQVAVSRLRALIEPGRARGAEPALLVTSGAGYALLADPEAVDLERFTRLVEEADTALSGKHPEIALRLCEAGIGLWAGAPFGDVLDCELIRSETTRLEELRLQAHELRVQALLALDRHTLVTSDLESLVRAHPFRERLWELLTLALYRSGRQGEALAALRRAREVLADELGVDPSPALRELEADVLAQAPWLSTGRRPVLDPPATPPVPATPTSPSPVGMIGRSDVLAELQGHLDRVLAGHSETLIISGEAGIGKTRMVNELAELAGTQGARVLWGRCHEADYSPSFWPWLPILRQLAPAHPGALIAGLLSPTDAPSSVDAGSAELRTYDAVSALLAQSAAERPLVIVIEDLHWADTSSLRLLTYAAETLPHERVMLVATLRDKSVPTPALQACLGALGRLQARRIPLAGLAPGQVGDLVASLSGGNVEDELVTIVNERTDGNPFFVIELVRLLTTGQRLHAAGARDVPVPHGVQDVVRLRLAGLTPAAGRLLQVAAVIGREFDLVTVSEVSGTDPETAITLLDEAAQAHAVEDADQPDRYRFSHALVRETLTTQLSLARRGRLHAAIAIALESRHQDDPELATALAHHFVIGATVRPELAESAVRYAVAAARLAENRGALDEALRHWEHAITADGLAPGSQPRRRYDVLLGLGRARHRRGEIVSSREALNAAVALGRDLGDIVLIAEAATSYRGAGVWRWREVGMGDETVIAALQECARALPASELRARVLASLAMEMTHEWCSPAADDISRQALELAREIGTTDLIADVISLRMLMLWGRPGAAGERLALAAEALRLPLSKEQELYARFGAAAAHLQHGEPAAADREVIRCTELARRLRHTGADVPIAWWRFYRAVANGNTDLVATTAGEIIEKHKRSQIVALNELESMAQLHNAGAGAPVPGSFVTQATGNANPAFRTFVAHALAETGRVPEAVALLGESTPTDCWHYSSMYADCLRVAVLALAEPGPELALALSRIEPWAGEFVVAGSTDYLGSVEYFIGRGREGLGDLDGARAAYRRAVDRNRDANVVPWLHRARNRLSALSA
jgi:DNA-binding SARP family transcriptional activator/tetratricopeptide (TPR) repeat protein